MDRWERNAVLAFGQFDTAQKAETPAWQDVRDAVEQAQRGARPWPNPSDLADWMQAVERRDQAHARLRAALAESNFSASGFTC